MTANNLMQTKKPDDGGLVSVSIIAKEGRLCDALSTDGGEIYLTEGIADAFTLNENFSDREVQLIRK